MNQLGAEGTPFLFIIDFECRHPHIIPLADVDPKHILYDIRGVRNCPPPVTNHSPVNIIKHPISFQRYNEAFTFVVNAERAGDSYLCNLTFPTPIDIELSLEEVFARAQAPYRLLLRDEFVVFSPESFVRIRDGVISAYPMKGTIRADIPDAENILLSDEKEFAEHLTIVDLLRNDLRIVSKQVRVERFRYIDRIETSNGPLLQMSSHITGMLPVDYRSHIGDILYALLPAGSVTGAPKRKTVDIIKAAEGYQRGYYTGVFGYFDGNVLDSAVMIRFIEKTESGFVYKSGGGITVYSDPKSEYQELIDKIYVPVG
jgi:para-aminobenzoate synthetase component 1